MTVPTLHLRLADASTGHGGVSAVNGTIAAILRKRFRISERAEDATLQICSLDWDAPPAPRRLFVDHGSFADASFWAYRAPKLFSTDTVLVASQVCVRVAERMLEAPGPRFRVVPFFADTEMFAPPADRASLRAAIASETGVPADGPLLLVVAAYVRRKNLHLAVRFLGALSERVSGARLALVGTPAPTARAGAYRDSLRSLAADLGLAPRVHFLDAMPHTGLSRLMGGADLLVHLSTCRLENFGLVVGEASAAGLPVVASDWGGFRDLVDDWRTGLLAPTWLTAGGPRVDWLGAAGAAADLLSDPARMSAMSEAATKSARARLTLAAFEDRLVLAVDEALGDPGGSSRPARLTPRGQDLMFAMIQIDRAHTAARSTSAEYDLLLAADAELSRFLTGPAATWERPPEVRPGDQLYAVVPFELSAGMLRIADPAWPGEFAVSTSQRNLLAGIATHALAAGDPESLLAARELAEAGVLAVRGARRA